MERLVAAVRYSTGFAVLGALIGAGTGLVLGLRDVASNEYTRQAPQLARWTVIDRTSEAMWQGVLIALTFIAVFVLLSTLLRLFLGNWRRACTGAAIAIPLLGAYLIAAWWINRALLPGALSPISIAGNIVLALLAFAAWYALLRWASSRTGAGSEIRTIALLRPAPLIVMLLAIVAVQSAHVFAKPAAAQDATNVLLIVVDALRPDRLGAYGYTRQTSPNLDRLAADGWQFMNALSIAPWTKPSIASLMTGLSPRQHGISSAGWNLGGHEKAAAVSALPRSLLTLPEILANAGYRTAAFGENHHLIAKLGFDQGFEVHDMAMTD
ncbi:MAG: sulfatase-like hydrolase/transferase, partial [Steroidobacteraceae bacterium]